MATYKEIKASLFYLSFQDLCKLQRDLGCEMEKKLDESKKFLKKF